MWSVRAVQEPEPLRSMCGPTGHRMTAADDPILLGGSLITAKNLSNYWRAMASCSDDVFGRLWDTCCIIEHREQATSPQLPIQRVNDQLLRNGRVYCTPTTQCAQRPRQRCDEGRGDFRFPWRGHWTTDNCIGNRLMFEAELVLARATSAELAESSNSSDEEAVEKMRAEAAMVNELAAMLRGGAWEESARERGLSGSDGAQ